MTEDDWEEIVPGELYRLKPERSQELLAALEARFGGTEFWSAITAPETEEDRRRAREAIESMKGVLAPDELAPGKLN